MVSARYGACGEAAECPGGLAPGEERASGAGPALVLDFPGCRMRGARPAPAIRTFRVCAWTVTAGYQQSDCTSRESALKGTFSKPMPDGKGSTIAPTGKAFAIDMVPVGILEPSGHDGRGVFFRDNQTFYTKMGLG